MSAAAAAGTSQSSPSQSPIAIAAPEWRGEVAQRIRSYRARRNGEPEESESEMPQTALPFDAETEKTVAAIEDEMDDPLQAALASAASRAAELPALAEAEPANRAEPKIYERLEIDVSRPAATEVTDAPLPANARRYEGVLDPRSEPVYPVASLELRRRAGIIDATILALASLAIFSGFVALGGRFGAGKTEILICLATVGLLAAQYFTLFTIMGGTTPGMMITGLRLVSFEGDAPAPCQLIWRSIGYLISGGTAFLGYLWSMWDEDELTWHDRISQTYITPSEAAAVAEAPHTRA